MKSAKPLLALLFAASLLPGPAQAERPAARAPFFAATRMVIAGQYKAARAPLIEAINADPDWELPHFVQARVFAELGDGLSANAAIQRAIARGLDPDRARHLQAQADLLLGDLDGALATADPEMVPTKFAAYAARVRGLARLAAGNFGAAGEEFALAGKLGPETGALWVDRARLGIFTGDVAFANGSARRAVMLEPRNPQALTLMGQLVRSQFGLVAAIPWFERVVQVDPGNVDALLELAATYGDAGRATDMLLATRRALGIEPTNPRAFYLQAMLAARAGNYDLSRSLMNRTKGKLDALPAAVVLNAVLEIKAGNEELAIARLRDLVDTQPDNMNVRRLLGTALWRTGDSQGAVDALLPIADRSDADSYSLTLVGRAFEKLGNRKRAAIYLDRAARPVQVDPVPFGTLDDLGVIERNNADAPGNAKTAIPLISRLLLAGRSAEALAKAQDMQRQNPGVPAAHVLVGDALMALNRPADAASAYKRAANIDFSESTVLRLVEAQQRSGDSAGVVRTLDLFLSQNPRNVPVSLLIAEHYLSVKQWDKAIETLESLRSRVGDRDAAILNNLAWAWLNKGDEKRALVYARAAYQLSQTNPAVASTYGWMLYKSGSNIAAGIALLEKAVSSTPGNATLHYQLAQAYAATGKRELAKKQLLLALADRSFHDGVAAKALLAKL